VISPASLVHHSRGQHSFLYSAAVIPYDLVKRLPLISDGARKTKSFQKHLGDDEDRLASHSSASEQSQRPIHKRRMQVRLVFVVHLGKGRLPKKQNVK
jgi:hypothetical protein